MAVGLAVHSACSCDVLSLTLAAVVAATVLQSNTVLNKSCYFVAISCCSETTGSRGGGGRRDYGGDRGRDRSYSPAPRGGGRGGRSRSPPPRRSRRSRSARLVAIA
jgi:hypothetical protein